MFEAYSVAAEMVLKDRTSPSLLAIAKNLEKVDLLINKIQGNLKQIGLDAAGLKSVSSAANASARAMERASVAALTLEQRIAAIRATSNFATPNGIPMVPMVPGVGGGGSAGGGRGGYHRNGLHGGNIHAGPNGVGVGTFGYGVPTAAILPLAIGAGGLWLGYKGYEAAKEYQTEKARFMLYGLSDAQNRDAFDYAARMRIFGTARIENQRNFREAQGVFRESGENDSRALIGAKLAAPVLSQLDFLAKTVNGVDAERLHTANMAMLRYVELSGGLKDASTFNRLADFGWKLNQTSGGTIDWEQLRQLKSIAGVAGYNLSEDALARLAPILSELKGSGTGTGMRMAYQRLTGVVRMPNQAAHAMVDAGIWDPGKIEWNANGGIKRFRGNPLGYEKTRLLEENPELFYESIIRPAYLRMKLKPEEFGTENALIFGSSGARMFTAIERAIEVINASVKTLDKAKGIEESVKIAKQTAEGQETEFTASWTDFKTSFGTMILPQATKLLQGGSEMFRALDQFVSDNKGLFGAWGTAVGTVYKGYGWLLSHTPAGMAAKAIFGKDAPANDEPVGTYFNRYEPVGTYFTDPKNANIPESRYVRTGGGKTSGHVGNVYMDHKKVGVIMGDEIGGSMLRQVGTMSFDSTADVPPIRMSPVK